MRTFPKLSYACPIPWNEMRGDERERFCSKCSRTVVNLSLLTEERRIALLAEAQSQPGGLCVAYYQRLSGEFVSAEKPLTPAESRRVVQFGLTALSAAALAVVAHQVPVIGPAVEAAGKVAGSSYVSIRDHAIESAKDTMATIGEFFGGEPKDPPVFQLMGAICPAPVPATAPAPAPPTSPPIDPAPVPAGAGQDARV
jgi:hypothetical protein